MAYVLIGLRMDCQDLLKTMFSRLFISRRFWAVPRSHPVNRHKIAHFTEMREHKVTRQNLPIRSVSIFSVPNYQILKIFLESKGENEGRYQTCLSPWTNTPDNRLNSIGQNYANGSPWHRLSHNCCIGYLVFIILSQLRWWNFPC
jgi:hypothetical protein